MTSVILTLIGLLLAAWMVDTIPVGVGRMAAMAIAWQVAGFVASARRRVVTRRVPSRLFD